MTIAQVIASLKAIRAGGVGFSNYHEVIDAVMRDAIAALENLDHRVAALEKGKK